jgi:lysophospholipase L1-like esterase
MTMSTTGYYIAGANPLAVAPITFDTGGVTDSPHLSYNSLVCRDMAKSEWQSLASNAGPPPVTPRSIAETSGNFWDAALVNVALGIVVPWAHWITIPAGCTSITFSCDAQYSAGNHNPTMVVYNAAQSAIISKTIAPPTGSWATFTITATVTPGQNVAVGFDLKTGGQSSCYFANPVVTVNNSAAGSIFGSPYIRIAAHHELLFGNHRKGDIILGGGALFAQHAPLAELRFRSNAQAIATEVFNNTGTSYVIGYRVNSRPLVDITGPTGIQTYIEERTLPAAVADPTISTNEIAVVVGDNASYFAQALGQNYLRAVYVPATTPLYVQRHYSNRNHIIYCDSMSVGVGSASPWRHGWAALLKARFAGEACGEFGGGRRFYDDANTAGLQNALAFLLTRNAPSDILMLMGFNDYFQHPWAAAAYGTAYTAVLAKIVARAPAAKIWCISPIPAVNEADQGGGTLGAYRTQVSTAAATQANAVFIDGTTLCTTADLIVDGIHPTSEGHAKIYRAISSNANMNIY